MSNVKYTKVTGRKRVLGKWIKKEDDGALYCQICGEAFWRPGDSVSTGKAYYNHMINHYL